LGDRRNAQKNSFIHQNAQICGCTDPLANNFNPLATSNDGTCTYNTSIVSPESSWSLPTILNETSGLICNRLSNSGERRTPFGRVL